MQACKCTQCEGVRQIAITTNGATCTRVEVSAPQARSGIDVPVVKCTVSSLLICVCKAVYKPLLLNAQSVQVQGTHDVDSTCSRSLPARSHTFITSRALDGSNMCIGSLSHHSSSGSHRQSRGTGPDTPSACMRRSRPERWALKSGTSMSFWLL